MYNRGYRRKATFHKAARHARVYEYVTGDSYKRIGELGRFKKDTNLDVTTDPDEDCKHSDKKRYVGSIHRIRDYGEGGSDE